RHVSQRLRDLSDREVTIARLGGDEFALLYPLERIESSEPGQLARRIVASLCKPFAICGIEVEIGATIGMALHPIDGQTSEKLLMAADLALYAAKRAGRGRVLGFTPAIEREYRTRIAIETRLRQAVETEDFQIIYQPLYATDGSSLHAFEALLSMKDSEGNTIAPAVFIPVAEELRLIDCVCRWALIEACRAATLWPENLSVAVNLSALQFLCGNLCETVRVVLMETGLNPKRLKLELGAGVLLDRPEDSLIQLHAIKAMGVSITLSDFGTGHSSLSYLWRFPFDTLKVDSAFTSGLSGPQSRSHEVLNTIVALGRMLTLHITAEGAETQKQIEILRSLHCDSVQVYRLGKPVASADVALVILDAFRPQPNAKPDRRIA
ncbi:MAG: putative bifunctional diguanylate cyclase/phosphodiesterase, partial [Rhabdaerophilum sp.]